MRSRLDTSLEDAVLDMVADADTSTLDLWRPLAHGDDDPDFAEGVLELIGLPEDDLGDAAEHLQGRLGRDQWEAVLASLEEALGERGIALPAALRTPHEGRAQGT